MAMLEFDTASGTYRFARSYTSRVILFLFALLTLMLITTLAVNIPPDPQATAGHHPAEIWSGVLIKASFASLLLIPLIAFLHGAGPEEITLDAVSGAYRFRRGFPLIAREQTGYLSDIDRLYMAPGGDRKYPKTELRLAWRGRPAHFMDLGDGDASARSEIVLIGMGKPGDVLPLAQALAARLQLPRDTDFYGSPWQKQFRQHRTLQLRQRLAAVIILIGALIPLCTVPFFQLDNALSKEGQVTPGYVYKVYTYKGTIIHFNYQVNGQNYDGSDQVAKVEDLSTYPFNVPIQVIYLPQYPATCRTSASIAVRPAAGGVVMAAILMALSLSLFCGSARELRDMDAKTA